VRRHRRRILTGAAVAAVLLVAAVTWLGVRGLLAKGHLDQARAELSSLSQDLLAGEVDATTLNDRAASVARHTAAARRLTGDPVWAAAGKLPGLGCTVQSVRGLVATVDDVAAAGLPAMAEVGGELAPNELRHGNGITVSAFEHVAEPVKRADQAVTQLRGRVERTATCGSTGEAVGLPTARTELLAQSTRLADALHAVGIASRLAPSMLGADGPRRYLLVVQNPGESRATGGIIGGFGLLTVTDGQFSLDGISGNNSLPGGPTQGDPALNLPPEFVQRYGEFWPDRIWANANLTPDYPMVSRIYTSLYQRGTGVTVDGTISVAPTPLSYLLAATKPAVLPDGRVVTADAFVKLVTSDVYDLIQDTLERDEFFATVGEAAYDAVLSGAGSNRALLDALGRAAGEGRLLVSSNHPEEQDVLVTTALGGALRPTGGPLLAVVTQNATAGKMDYWLQRETDYRIEPSPGGGARARVEVRLTNNAPATLGPYVRQRSDLHGPGRDNPTIQNYVWTSVYTGAGSVVETATVDGQPLPVALGTENGLPVVSFYLPIDRGATRSVVLEVREPTYAPTVSLWRQALVTPEIVRVEGARAVPLWTRNVGN
jgi:uncharacterized protein DUF4012